MATRREIREAEKSMTSMLLEVIGPALIILMVGSLVFFLIEVFYRGPHTGRLCWVFGLFTFASVLVSRVSIESGRERAIMLGTALGIASFVTSFTLVEFEGVFAILLEPIILISFILIVMWSSSKLTWDCTVIDQSRDTSAIGITELVRRRFTGTDRPSGNNTATEERQPESQSAESDAQAGNLIKAFFQSKGRRKNTPGIWVFYFSMAALPIFGIGQWFVLPDSEGGYGWVVFLFGIYLASGLALMMTTSLLGLQRYLRKRKTYMPPEIARTWMAIGTVVSIVVLALVMLIPRPNASHSIAKSLKWFTSPPRKSSEMAFGKDGTEEKQSGNSSKSSEQGKQSSSDANTKQTSGTSKDGKKTQGGGKSKGKSNSSSSSKSQQKGGQKSGKQKSENGSQNKSNSKQQNQSNQNNGSNENASNQNDNSENSLSDQGKEPQTNVPDHMRPDKSAEEARKRNEEKAKQENEQDEKSQSSNSNQTKSNKSQNPNQRSNSPTPNTPKPPSFEALNQIATVITYVVAALATLTILILFRKELLAAIRAMIAELQNLFGKKAKPEETPGPSSMTSPSQPTTRPFAHFQNPFSTGANSMTPEQTVEYTFQALESWAAEHGMERPQDQTPHEFASSLDRTNPAIARAATLLANLFCRNLFADRAVLEKELGPLKELWSLMQNNTADNPSTLAVASG